MIIAVEGCAHGELKKIYDSLAEHERVHNIKVDLVLICGDFQSTRNHHDLASMACPKKYRSMCTFYKYYTGELIAPVPTVFIGGNHEASNYLTELWFGGWAAPNIYYLGNNGVVNFGGLRIAGLSGIFKGYDYYKGWSETFPLNKNHQRSIFHIRRFQNFQLEQLQHFNVDIFLSHDWPSRIYQHGDVKRLLSIKKHFRQDVQNECLGSPPLMELLEILKPTYWYAAHLHVKFPAVFDHPDGKCTRFLALDKCLPNRGFLQLFQIDAPNEEDKILKYDPVWLTILRKTQSKLKHGVSLPVEENMEKVTDAEIEETKKIFGDLTIHPDAFVATVEAYDASRDKKSERNGINPKFEPNPQTLNFCKRLGFDDFWTKKICPDRLFESVEEEVAGSKDDDDDEWGMDIFSELEARTQKKESDLQDLLDQTEQEIKNSGFS